MRTLIFLVNIIFLVTCNITNMNSCENIENAIHHTVLESFELKSCTKQEILTNFNLTEEDSHHFYLGKNMTTYTYYEWWEEKCEIRLWFDNQNLIKVDINKYIEYPDNLILTFGVPKLKLDYYTDVIPREQKAYIYPEKGLAFYFDEIPNKLEQISYFEPTTAQVYIESLHDFSIPREFPMY